MPLFLPDLRCCLFALIEKRQNADITHHSHMEAADSQPLPAVPSHE